MPADNPCVGQTGALPEIWSYGHRNPQGLAIHPDTGDVWINEHGPQGGDELNLVQPGLNYGWPVSFSWTSSIWSFTEEAVRGLAEVARGHHY